MGQTILDFEPFRPKDPVHADDARSSRSLLTADRLRLALGLQPFDGRAAQRLVEPVRRGDPPARVRSSKPRRAGALAYVFERGGGLHLPFTVRRPDLPEHRGQVSLPGGRPLPGETLHGTALREAREEIGLDLTRFQENGVEHLGELAPVFIPVTHTWLHVHVVLGPDPGALEACPREVDRIVVVRLDDLLDPARLRERRITIGDVPVDVPFFDVDGLFLWGATAMAVSELVERLRAV